MNVVIRDETEADRAAIRDVLGVTLGAAEARLLDALRTEEALLTSLVAIEDDAVIGHTAASRLGLGAARASVLAPLAVVVDRRRGGVASRLVARLLEQRRAAGDDVMLVLGDPAFYARFGFSAEAARPFRTPYDGPYQHAAILIERAMRLGGAVRYPCAFAGLS